MNTGTVQKFFDERGFGFIRPDGEDKDLFVHIRDVDHRQIFAGDTVEFDVEIDRRRGRPHAVNVRVI